MINNFTIAENYHGGAEFYLANFTKEMVSVNNCAIIGQSQTNMAADTTNYTSGMAAVITPRTGFSNFTNTRFYNYPAGSVVFVVCSKCDDVMFFNNLGTEVVVKNLTFDQVDGDYLLMLGLKRDIIYDLDGSLSSAFDGRTRASATITYNFPHISAYNRMTCLSPADVNQWDNAIMCDHTVTLRRIFFTNPVNPSVFNAQFMKVKPLGTYDEVVDPATNSSLLTAVQSRFLNKEPKKEKPQSWSLPYITGQTYQVWWGSGIDFSHMSAVSSRTYSPSDAGVIFKFNYTLNREIFEVGPMRGGKLLQSLDFITRTDNIS